MRNRFQKSPGKEKYRSAECEQKVKIEFLDQTSSQKNVIILRKKSESHAKTASVYIGLENMDLNWKSAKLEIHLKFFNSWNSKMWNLIQTDWVWGKKMR